MPDFAAVTFLIPLRIDSEQQEMNLLAVLRYLDQLGIRRLLVAETPCFDDRSALSSRVPFTPSPLLDARWLP